MFEKHEIIILGAACTFMFGLLALSVVAAFL